MTLEEQIAATVRQAVAVEVRAALAERGADSGRLAYNCKQAADAVGVSYRTMKRWTDAGTVPTVRIGGTVLIRRDTLQELMRRNEQGGPECHERPASNVERVFRNRRSGAMAKDRSSIEKTVTDGLPR